MKELMGLYMEMTSKLNALRVTYEKCGNDNGVDLIINMLTFIDDEYTDAREWLEIQHREIKNAHR